LEIGNSIALYFMWIAAAAALLFMLELASSQRALARFVSAGTLPKIVKGYSRRRKIVKRSMIVAALVLAILAWAMPRVGRGMKTVKHEGADVVLAFDLSASMLTGDVKPNRLEAARRAAETLVSRLSGDRVALVGFADDAFIYCPLTLDQSALNMFLDYLSPGAVVDQGTNLSRAIEQSVKALTTSSGKGRAVVIITDGEDHGSGVDAAVKLASGAGVKVFTVGVGTERGEPIPILDAKGNVSGYKRDRDDNVVVSRLNTALLREIARSTGGETYVLGPGEKEIAQIAAAVQGLEKGVLEQRSFEHYVELFQIPLGLALLVILGESFVSERKKKTSDETETPR
jgi:Ca-activated chloride channel family protein